MLEPRCCHEASDRDMHLRSSEAALSKIYLEQPPDFTDLGIMSNLEHSTCDNVRILPMSLAAYKPSMVVEVGTLGQNVIFLSGRSCR
ncbi:hypothetical protein BX600DRAFT_445311 [Xylariales sp. PMI_506]|nr:hypothetical protein BX600DRAFT_445311 [Xylariales sp. PMI_506]